MNDAEKLLAAAQKNIERSTLFLKLSIIFLALAIIVNLARIVF